MGEGKSLRKAPKNLHRYHASSVGWLGGRPRTKEGNCGPTWSGHPCRLRAGGGEGSLRNDCTMGVSYVILSFRITIALLCEGRGRDKCRKQWFVRSEVRLFVLSSIVCNPARSWRYAQPVSVHCPFDSLQLSFALRPGLSRER